MEGFEVKFELNLKVFKTFFLKNIWVPPTNMLITQKFLEVFYINKCKKPIIIDQAYKSTVNMIKNNIFSYLWLISAPPHDIESVSIFANHGLFSES